MTLATTIFAPLLEFLASDTAGEAKTAGDPTLSYNTQNVPDTHDTLRAFATAEIGFDVTTRLCCSFGNRTETALDASELAPDRPDKPHLYQPVQTQDASLLSRTTTGGGKSGYVYTRAGGFIDLGHVRDYIDYTRFFAARFRDTPTSGWTVSAPRLIREEGDIHLVVPRRIEKPKPVVDALVGVRLAYDRATWHEISSMFSPETELEDQRFSCFSPEDSFSNAVGVLAGFRAVVTANVDFNKAADDSLFHFLLKLRPASKADTEKAIDYVKDHWFVRRIISPRPETKRRNFDAFSPVAPWLVTDIAVPGKDTVGDELRASLGRPKAATISMPSHYNGLALDQLAYLEITNVNPSIQELVPDLTTIKSSDFPAVVHALRIKVRRDQGNDVDSPGPIAP